MLKIGMLRVFGVALVLFATSVAAENVVFSDKERAASPEAIYMDRWGDLYPPSSVSVNTAALLNGDPARPDVPLDKGEFAALEALYRWEASKDSARWQALLQHVGSTPSGDFDKDWDGIQATLRNRIVSRLNAETAPEILLLIHGFNNSHAESSDWYADLEADLRARRQGLKIFRVYWDGLSYGVGPGIWGEAQYNGPYVGQELRRILNQLKADIPLRIFTHSSGAFVLSNALGDGTRPFTKAPRNGRLVTNAAGRTPGYELPRQLTDLRVAMLVPAAPPNTFANFAQGANGAIPAKFVLGNSRKDSATSKHLAPCHIAGNTCMSTRPKDACHAVGADLGIAPPRLVVVDFPRPFWFWQYHGHGVVSYMEDEEEWEQLVSNLFDDAPAVPPGTTRWCPAT